MVVKNSLGYCALAMVGYWVGYVGGGAAGAGGGAGAGAGCNDLKSKMNNW